MAIFDLKELQDAREEFGLSPEHVHFEAKGWDTGKQHAVVYMHFCAPECELVRYLEDCSSACISLDVKTEDGWLTMEQFIPDEDQADALRYSEWLRDLRYIVTTN